MSPRHAKPAIDDLADHLASSTEMFSGQLEALTRALFLDDPEARDRAERRIGAIIAGTGMLSDLLGRRRLLLELDSAGVQFADPADLIGAGDVQIGTRIGSGPLGFVPFPNSPFGRGPSRGEVPGAVPGVPFTEAINDILSREPRLVDGYLEVQEVYSLEHGFAAARSTSKVMTARLQEAIAQAIIDGHPLANASEAVQKIGSFSRAYSDTVFRTNASTAYAAGRFRLATDPDVSHAVPGMMYVAVGDADTRRNHGVLDGFRASTDSDAWDRVSPPNGYNCRCSIVPIPRIVARRNGWLDDQGRLKRMRVPSGGGRDAGFSSLGRPDRALYGGA